MKYDSCLIKMLKYFAMFIVAFLALSLVPKSIVTKEEILIISLIITTFYAFIEIYFPSVYIDNFVI